MSLEKIVEVKDSADVLCSHVTNLLPLTTFVARIRYAHEIHGTCEELRKATSDANNLFANIRTLLPWSWVGHARSMLMSTANEIRRQGRYEEQVTNYRRYPGETDPEFFRRTNVSAQLVVSSILDQLVPPRGFLNAADGVASKLDETYSHLRRVATLSKTLQQQSRDILVEISAAHLATLRDPDKQFLFSEFWLPFEAREPRLGLGGSTIKDLQSSLIKLERATEDLYQGEKGIEEALRVYTTVKANVASFAAVLTRMASGPRLGETIDAERES